MAGTILTLAISSERDTVAARQRARQIARLLGFDAQDQTRISTAVSEIARNAFNYAGGGRVEYSIEGRTSPQLFIIKVKDSGPGVRDLESILEGRYESSTGMGMGIIGARRLMDHFQIESAPGQGTTVWLKKLLPAHAPLWHAQDLGKLAGSIAGEGPRDAFQELQYQNQELLRALEEIRNRQAELAHLNRELEDTNRGVVALYAELDEKADHLRRADELKSRFLSNMSHEFRSPLNSILALSRLLLDRSDGDLTAEQDQQVDYIRRAAHDLLDLVNDLLDLAKVEAGKVEVKPVEFFAADLFGALRGMLRPMLLNQAVDLVFEDVEHVPEIFSDEGKISQILRNFISNALKFTERGEVRVSAKLAGSDVIFSVADTGIGIAPEDQHRIFQDFVQLDNPIQRRVKGTGLGLPLSKQLATLLAGEVRLHSQLGQGSTFSVRIPLRYNEQSERDASPLALRAAASHNAATLPVLVVEDKPEMMMMYRSYLKSSGFHAVPAGTIREARQALESTRPAAIILDVVLRSEESWQFLAGLKQDAQTQSIPVTVISTIEDQAKAFHLGADAYLVKPIEKPELLNLLHRLVNATVHRVLVIDDNERDRYLIKQQFRNSGFLIQEAAAGPEGIEAAKARPKAIVLDLSMPGMNGFEVLDALKNDVATKDIPVVVCTSRVLSEAERLQLAERTVAIVSKGGPGANQVAESVRKALHPIEISAAM